MKKKILSRSDVVERMAKRCKSCSWWRSYFKYYGWKWDVIWQKAVWQGLISIGNEEGD